MLSLERAEQKSCSVNMRHKGSQTPNMTTHRIFFSAWARRPDFVAFTWIWLSCPGSLHVSLASAASPAKGYHGGVEWPRDPLDLHQAAKFLLRGSMANKCALCRPKVNE